MSENREINMSESQGQGAYKDPDSRALCGITDISLRILGVSITQNFSI